MTLYVSDGHPFCIHGQNLLFNALTDAGLVLFQRLRFKFSLPVLEDEYAHFSEVSTQRFAAVSILAVVRVLISVVVLCCTTVGHPALDILHAADIDLLQQFLNLCLPHLFFWGAICLLIS